MDRRKILLVLAAVIAALGTLLVFLYVQAADDRAKEEIEATDVLKVIKPIEPGEKFDDAVAAGKFQMTPVPRDQVLDGAQTDLEALSGQIAVTRIFQGEQLTANRWGGTVENTSLAIPDGMLAISVNLSDPARVAGFVSPGSEVAVFLTATTTGGPATQLLLERVQVLGVGTTSTITSTRVDGSGQATTEQLPKTLLTLALSQQDAEKVIFATSNGDLAFGLLTESSEVNRRGSGVNGENLFQ
ncbi:Flp pilus assembly protein CpaB [Nocardioides sp. AE5]|uniref:Flp pilus assembly protein CpaB n=1 Tax=Nocardioides sp. AE5 TaxID=2962573 RepID=UPI002882B4BC|nr:Flp pilus assembly protein CpaB [Nocardioides sp. AE5]MDT0201205.1 Flp pilus assembly protein CpaB [Nocardioides sp. AE5]